MKYILILCDPRLLKQCCADRKENLQDMTGEDNIFSHSRFQKLEKLDVSTINVSLVMKDETSLICNRKPQPMPFIKFDENPTVSYRIETESKCHIVS